MFFSIALLAAFSGLVAQVTAESHEITFTNNCGHGTPKLKQGGNTLSTGNPYTSNGPFSSAIAYLDNGCGANGEHCTMVEINLSNAGNGANSVDITLTGDHAFSDAAGFQFTGACSGQGAFCGEGSCNTAFHQSDDTCVQVSCPGTDAGVNVIFCGGSTHFTDPSQPGAPCGSTSSTAGSTGNSTSIVGGSSSSSIPGSSSSTIGASTDDSSSSSTPVASSSSTAAGASTSSV